MVSVNENMKLSTIVVRGGEAKLIAKGVFLI